MLKVALVGNIASGKSAVEAILKKNGYSVLDTDKVCHNLLGELPQVAEEFVKYDVFEDGKISREKLGTLVFNNPDLRKKLENILYPTLREKINEFFNSSDDLMFVAIPLFFEAEMTDLFDKILFIYADDKIRLKRLIKRNNYTKEYAKLRMESQMPQEDKVKKSDVVIYNNSTLEELEQNVKISIEQIR